LNAKSRPGIIQMKKVLVIIVISQFFCTSLWFAGNAIMPDLIKELHLDPGYLAHITSVVQFGFISGTLVFALGGIPDRFSPSLVFLISSLIAALFNAAVSFGAIPIAGILSFRFLTGFFLAGIYPVGMKIAADYYQQSLGRSLGFLVGALVLGTSFPHLLKSITTALPWKYVIYCTSLLAVAGGIAIYLLVPDGPHRTQGIQPKAAAFLKGFKNKAFRAAAFGYFGHMWELYAFWAFIPVVLAAYKTYHPGAGFDLSFLSFCVIASGSIGCIMGGWLSQSFGAKKVATIALCISGICCLISPLLLLTSTLPVLLVFLLTWGMSVTADSPLFSSLVAQNAPPAAKGASITIVTSIGFAITIVSIQLLNILIDQIDPGYLYLFLAPGPVLGLLALLKKNKRSNA